MNDLPTLCSDLEIITKDNKKDPRSYLIRKTDSGEVYELKNEDFFLCNLFNGQNSLSEIKSQFADRFNVSINSDQLKAFINQLDGEGLLIKSAIKSPFLSILSPNHSSESRKEWNLFDPDKLVMLLYANFRWCYTKAFVITSATLFFLAFCVLLNNFTVFLKELKYFTSSLTVGYLFFVTYLIFNIPSQIVQGITITHYGGHARGFGVRLLFDIIPRFYCKISWKDIHSKSDRFWILFSPSYYAFLTASVGMLSWKIISPGLGLHKFGIMLVAIGTIQAVVRINVLWPSDASQILSNMLGIRSFQKRSIAVARSWLLFQPLPEPLTSRNKQLFKWYGLLAGCVIFITIVAVVCFLSRLLIYHFNGIGALILLLIVTISYRKRVFPQLKRLEALQWISKKGGNAGFVNRNILRWILITVAILLLFVPYPYKSGGFFRFLPIERIELSAQVAGEVKSVLVKEGEWVEEGQVIALLDIREHQKNVDIIFADLGKAEADLHLMEAGPKLEEIVKARQQVSAALKRYEYSSREAVRFKELFESDIISENEFLTAAKTADVDAENLEVSKSHLELIKSGARSEEIEAQESIIRDLETKLRYYQGNVSLTKLIAPITGQIVTPYIKTKVGKILEAGDLFAIIQDTRSILAEIQLPESDISEVKIGARVKVRPWAYPTRFFYGEVVSIAPKVDEADFGKVVRVLTEIPNHNLELKPDMTGEAKIEGEWKLFIVAFTRPIVRFFTVEIWSWFP